MRVCFPPRQPKSKKHGVDPGGNDDQLASACTRRVRPAATFLNPQRSVPPPPSPPLMSKTATPPARCRSACWDHWVPGANNTLTKLCNEWGAKNNVEVKIDYITSQGEKDKLTAAAEAQAGTGHDIMSHRDWNIRIHQNDARAARRRRRRPDQAIRPDQPGRRISRQDQRHLARRADRGRQPGQAVLLALRSLPAACRHRHPRHVPRRRIEMGQGQDR